MWWLLILILIFFAIPTIDHFACMNQASAVAVFDTSLVKGTVTFDKEGSGTRVIAVFTYLNGLHGFHIHKAGDLRGEGCNGACDHYHFGPSANHGGPPGSGERHTGDLGNVTAGTYSFYLDGIAISDLYGRSVIIHADPDDLGRGGNTDSLTTGHSGARIACAIIGRSESK
jgi:Cu-Zn family superoxide dismutase